MAAPTNVRVESNSVATAQLNWSYAGANSVSVYRALHGGAYTSIATILPGTLVYLDETVATGVFYDYKLSDDSGGTFSSVVSVVVQTCPGAAGTTQSTSTPGLPQFTTEEDVNALNLQQISQQIEATLGIRVTEPQKCVACPTNGALIINCDDSCFNFIVLATTDINSISIHGCNTGKIEVVVPPNVTRKVCGWPAAFGFTGDECFNAPIIGGPNGRTVNVSLGGGAATATGSKKGYGGGGSATGGGGGGGDGCTCTPDKPNLLTIKSCNDDNSLDCSASKSLRLIACGGSPPYDWSNTGQVVLNRTTGTSVIVTPPPNPGSVVVGTAFTKHIYSTTCGHVAGTTHAAGNMWAVYGCADNFTSCSAALGGVVLGRLAFLDGTCDCALHVGHDTNIPAAGLIDCGLTGAALTECAVAQAKGAVEDRRTAGMITDGCNPCSLQAGATVSVTDSVGTVYTIVLGA